LDSLQAFINDNQVDVMGLSELNLAWHLIPTTSWLPALMAKWFESCHLGLEYQQTPVITLSGWQSGSPLY